MSSQGTGTGGQRMFEFTCTAVPAVENTCRRAGASDGVWERGCVGFQLGGQVDCKCASEREFMPSDVGRGMSLHVPRSD